MKPEIRKTRYCLIAIAGLLMVLLAQPALAVTKTWVGPNPDRSVDYSPQLEPDRCACGRR